jgi:dipeptidase
MKRKKSKLLRILYKIFTAILTSGLCCCTTIVVGKRASATGSVLLGHNEDGTIQISSLNRVPRLEHTEDEIVTMNSDGMIPQVKTTWSYLWSQVPGQLFCDFYINEWNVAVSSNGAPSKEDNMTVLKEAGLINDGGIDYWLRRLVAERAVNAREGVNIAISLIEQFGYNNSGRIYEIVDPDEAWILHVTAGKNYYAKRLNDDEVAVIPNNYILKEVDFIDQSNNRVSSGLKEYAEIKGWYDKISGKEFLFDDVFGVEGRGVLSEEGFDLRQWIGQKYIKGAPPEPGGLPFFIKPEQPITLEKMKQILRSHFENVPEEMIYNEKGNPHYFKRRSLCYNDTKESIIVEFGRNKPRGQDSIIWRAIGSPCLSIFIPVFNGISHIPEGYKFFEYDRALENQFNLEAFIAAAVQEQAQTSGKEIENSLRRNPMEEFYFLQKKVNENYSEISHNIYDKINSFEAYISAKLIEFEKALEIENKAKNKKGSSEADSEIQKKLTDFTSELSKEVWDWVIRINSSISS